EPDGLAITPEPAQHPHHCRHRQLARHALDRAVPAVLDHFDLAEEQVRDGARPRLDTQRPPVGVEEQYDRHGSPPFYLIGGRRALRALWSPAPPARSGGVNPPALAGVECLVPGEAVEPSLGAF